MALSEEQIENRRKYIGGSDARTILQGDADAWAILRAEKVDGVRPIFPQAQQLLMDMGSAIEPLTLREFDKKVPLMFEPPPHMVWKEDPILAFSPDGITEQDRLVVQCKFHTGDQNILDLAETYKAQLIHEMVCSNTSRMWLAVIFGHYGRFQHMEVKFDDELADVYLLRAMQFKEYLRSGSLPAGMEATVVPELKVERKRDHVWPTGDNEVAPICREIIDNMTQATIFNESLDAIKKLIKRKEYADCGSLTWKDAEGYGVTFKVDGRGAVRYHLAFPARTKKARV
jgi:hypothetical protein